MKNLEIHSDEDLIFSDESDESINEDETYQKWTNPINMQNKNSKLPKEIIELLKDVNEAYIFGNFDEAVRKCKEIIRLYPTYPEPYHDLALIYEGKGNLRKVAYYYYLAAKTSQSGTKFWERAASYAKEAKIYDQASYCFGRALKSEPLNIFYLRERSECYELMGEIKKATISLEKILEYNSKNQEILLKCAKLYANNKQFDKSIKKLEILLEMSESKWEIIFQITELYQKEEKYHECIGFLESYFDNSFNLEENLQRFPVDLVATYIECQTKLKNKNHAITGCNMLIKNYKLEKNTECFHKIAECLEELNQDKTALEVYNELNKCVDGNNSKISIKIAEIFLRLKDKKSAEKQLKLVLEKEPENVDARVLLADVYKNDGNASQALIILGLKNSESDDEKYKEDGEDGEEEEIYISDESPTIVRRKKPQKIARKKLDRGKMQSTLTKKQKLNNDNNTGKQVVNLKIEKLTKYEEKISFADDIEKEKSEIRQGFKIDEIKLKFKKAEILLEKGDFDDFIEHLYPCLILVLEVEHQIKKLKTKLLNKYLFESRKKTFKRAMKSKNVLKELDNPARSLMVSSKKQKDNGEFLLKKKTKLSMILTDKHFENLQYPSKIEGKERLIFFIIKMLELLFERGDMIRINELSLQTVQLEFLKDYLNEKQHVFIYGLISSCMLQKFEKAFYYMKFFWRKNHNSLYYNMILNLIFQKINNPNICRTFLSKLVFKVRTKSNVSISHIIGNGYLQSGNYDLAIKTFYEIYEKDPSNSLIILSLAAAFLQEATSRTTIHKIQNTKRAFHFFNLYKSLRESSYPCETYYNMGRAFAHFSMNIQAMEYLNKAILEQGQRTLILQRAGLKNNIDATDDQDNLQEKAAYNLVILYKRAGDTKLANELIKNYLII